MSVMSDKSSTPWWEKGSRPDYRFTLANERTFLAWIRTSLAVMAGAIAIEQFNSHFGNGLAGYLMSIFLVLTSAVIACIGYLRWRMIEYAIREQRDIPYTRTLITLALSVVSFAFVVALVFLGERYGFFKT